MRAKLAEKVVICEDVSRCVSRTVFPRAQQGDGVGQGLDRRPGQQVAVVDEPGDVRAAAAERRAELVDGGDEGVLGHRAHGAVDVEQEPLDGQWSLRAVSGDDVTVGEGRAAGGARLEVEVLLADRGAVLDDGAGVAGDLRAAVELGVHPDPVLREGEVGHPADAHAPVGDLGADEDASGGAEVGHDDGTAAQDPLGEPDVARRQDRDADDRHDREDRELDLGEPADHVAPPV